MGNDGKKIESIALGGGPLPPAGNLRGLRSPLVGAPAPAPAAPEPAAPAKPESSPLAFLDNQGTMERESATMLSAVMFDGGAQKRRNFSWILLVAALAGAGGAFWYKPQWRKAVIYRLSHAREDVINLVRYHKGPTTHGHEVGGDEPQATFADTPRAGRGTSKGGGEGCKALAQRAAGGGRMAVPQRSHLAECHMLIDDPRGAEDALKPLKPQLARAGERELNASKGADGLADAFLTLTQTYLRQGKLREADELLNSRCAHWEQSNSCVAKLMIAADRKLATGDGLGKMFGSHGRLDGKAQARLWLAGAELAGDAGKLQSADQRFGLALQAAPRDALALRKQIFEAQAVALFHRGETSKLKNAIDRALRDLAPLAPGAKLKLKMLADLSVSPGKAQTVRVLLGREDVAWSARGDLDIIDILGPEAIKTKNEEGYLALVHDTSAFFRAKYRSAAAVQKRLATWEVRALLAQEHFEQAREQLARFETAFGRDAWTRHMSGIAYMLQDKAQKYQVLAAQDFQEAIRLKPGAAHQWESLVALGLALTRAGKTEQASAVIKALDLGVSSKGQKYWVDMLKAEYYLTHDQLPSALSILNVWVRNQPGYVTPRRLRLQVFRKMGKRAEAAADQTEVEALNAATRYAGSREGFSSPIGVMAYGNRPLE